MADSRIEALLENWAGADNEILPPISNNERILQNILGIEGVDIEPIQSRVEALLLQILEQGGSGGSGGSGIDFEAGVWEPEEDVAFTWINYAKTHDTLPIFVCCQDATGDFINQSNSYLYECIYLFSNFSGEPVYQDASSKIYGCVSRRMLGSNVGLQESKNDLYSPATDMETSNYRYPRFWMNETSFKVGNDIVTNVYWRAGRTYKWIAVWPPAAE